MITFISSFEEADTEELEGRIVMQGFIDNWPTFRHPCRVIHKGDGSLTTERLLANYDQEQSVWLFIDKSAGEEQVIRLSDIRAICDSAAEANIIVRKSREAEDQFHRVREQLTLEFRELTTGSFSS
jgi:hypothetical protein